MKIGERLDVVEKFVRDADLADVVRRQVALVGIWSVSLAHRRSARRPASWCS